MGRDITLYPKKASRDDLKKYVESLGFKKCAHFWVWPKGTLNYAWFNYEDFKSIDGVSADIYPVSDDEENIKGGGWALHVQNRYSASWHDVKMLNDVLKGAKKLFGGTIKGDYGTNRYASLWEDNSTPLSRGVSAVYGHITDEISAVKYALPDSSFNLKEGVEDAKIKDFIEFTKTHDPSRVIYNGLIPFAVAMLEYFFSQVFQILIRYDSYAENKKSDYKIKVDFSTVLEVSKDKRTVEEIIARQYSFQNIEQINKAYKEWLGIDIKNVLYKKKKIGNSISFLENRVAEIIQYRHGIIHRFEIDRTLDKEGYLNILSAVQKTAHEFIIFLEKKYGVSIRE